ncbi:non-ribosomal peptide synthetase [Desulfobacter sp.]|uniref:non-ribosomal peptide synthetase n=1 Tax=Desulfobacter sp. TaxID=2294 RepID=UPI000E97254A|nr:non-ribosomal peptide synthetase [Desulfobacter sp.]HBT89718.1 non-ribosomal peptide synthetase [Desulfobacter sp.]
MTAEQLIQELSDNGVMLWEKNGNLHFEAPKGFMSDDIRQALSNQKQEIILLLQDVENEPAKTMPRIEADPKNRHQPFPLSDIQSAYLIGRDKGLELGNIACHSYFEFETPFIDMNRLTRALNKLILRHDALRLVFLENGTQKILEEVPSFEPKRIDLKGASETEVSQCLAAIREEYSHKIHPPGVWPLFDIHFIWLDHTVFVFVSFDQLIADFYSVYNMFRDLVKFYDDPDCFMEPMNLSFRDYVMAEQKLRETQPFIKARDYWMKRADNFPSAPQLPFKKSPTEIRKPNFFRRKDVLSPDEWDRLRKWGAVAQITPSVILITAYAQTLAKWSRTPNFAINLTLFDRLALHPQIMDVAGDFTVVSLLEIVSRQQDTFEQKARQIQKQLWKDMDNRHFSGVRFIRELARQKKDKGKALMPVVFSSMIGIEDSEGSDAFLAGSERFGRLTYAITQTPQVCLDHQALEFEGKLICIWDAIEELFPAGMLDEMFAAYMSTLSSLANVQNTWTRDLADLIPAGSPGISESNKEIKADIPADMLHTLFESQSRRYADKEAVVTSMERITYGELKRCSDTMAGVLHKNGAKPNTLAAVVMEKGWEQVAGALSILKAGAAYLPINPDLPRERISYLLKDGRVSLVLTQPWLKEKIDWPAGLQVFTVEKNMLCHPADLPPEPMQNPGDLAYVIYTSGSTGNPKGVMINHIGAVNTILDLNARFGVNGSDRILALASMDFDLSVYDVFGTLAAGGTIVMPDPQGSNDPAHWTELLGRESVTIWNSVPQVMQMLTEYLAGDNGTVPPSLRLVLMSGDWIPLKLPGAIWSLFPNAAVHSLGGATEASIWSIHYPIEKIDPKWKSIPYGRSIANQKFYVFDENLRHCPVWATGRLFIAGIGLALGYWRDPDKTSSSFFTHPETGERIYNTGDLGRYLPDKTIEFQGREDFQVKIRGYRIELGEIEAAIGRHESVMDSVVKVTGDQPENRRLTAYVVPDYTADSTLIETIEADPEGSETLRKSIAKTVENLAGKEFSALNADNVRGFYLNLEKISMACMYQALRDLGLFIHPGENYTLPEIMQHGGIQDRFEPLVGQWLDFLVTGGVLMSENERFYTNSDPLTDTGKKDTSVSSMQSAFFSDRHSRQLEAFVKILRINSGNLLQGRIDPLELFFSQGQEISPEHLTLLIPGADGLINLAGKILETICKTGSTEKTLEIIEIGSRTGEISARLIPFLPLGGVKYTCSDLSAFFTQKTRDRFSDDPRVQSLILDIEKNPGNQGYQSHTFDVIIAAHCLHRVRDIEKALNNVRTLLAPGGLLIMIEGTMNTSFTNISAGFIEEGFIHFEDQRAADKKPFLSRHQWQKALDGAGFKPLDLSFDPVVELLGQGLYVVQSALSTKTFNTGQLERYLKETLPSHMVPSHYLPIDAIPLTANGKINRDALPEPVRDAELMADLFAPPETETEISLAGIWRDVLQVDLVNVNESFFQSGGDSLLATRIVTGIRETFGLGISLRELFDSPSIRELSQYIAAMRQEGSTDEGDMAALPRIIPDPENENVPFALSDVQQAYVIGRCGIYELGNVAAHCYFEFDRTGLDIERAAAAWRLLVDRHGILRTVILNSGQQQILPEVPLYEISIQDLTGLSSEDSLSVLEEIRYEMSHQVLPMDRWPLFDIRATRYGRNRVRIHVSFDNLILDGWSMFHVLSEWSQLYKEPETLLAFSDLSFRDYILALSGLKQSELHARDREYWQARLNTLPPAPELPLVRNPKPGEHYRFTRFETRLEKGVWDHLKEQASKAGLTPSGLLLAAYAEIIHRWSNQACFTINLTTFNRLPLHPRINEIPGDFTSLALLSVHHEAAGSFVGRAANLQQQLWQDLDHPYFSGIECLRELAILGDSRQGAAMPVVFTSALGHDYLHEDALRTNHLGQLIYSISQTPQVLIDHQAVEFSGELMLIWDTAKDYFPEGLIEDMFTTYIDLLHNLAGDETFWHRDRVISLPGHQITMRCQVNSTEQERPEKAMLHTLFDATALRQPEHAAVITSSRQMSYREVAARCEYIGKILLDEGVKPNTLVAIVMEKGWEQIVGALGIHKSGAAYLPIDAKTPPERLAHIFADGDVEIVLTQSWLENVLEWPESIQCFCVDTMPFEVPLDWKTIPIQQDGDLAYVIYTSGSTGKPKGVKINHRGAVNTILDINQRFNVGNHDRTLALSNLNFDLSVYDLFGTLAAGGSIVLPDADKTKDPAHWAQLMVKERITIWNTVPALMQMLVEHLRGNTPEKIGDDLRLVLMSGDWIPLDLPDKIKQMAQSACVVSLGGATEASIWSILYPIETIDAAWKSIPYGKPMDNQSFHILNESMEDCPVWTPGNLFIGGMGLAEGYWRDPGRTSRSFITHPRTNEVLYYTGDLGRYLPDGNIEFLGRNDFQVKIRGYRIELGEIETSLQEHPAVMQAVVVAAGNPMGVKRLVAYIVTVVSVTTKDLHVFLEKKLPDYALPSIYNFIDAIPVTANGKVDRAKLEQLEIEEEKESLWVEPTTENEKRITTVWCSVLGKNRISIDADFFELGGNSFDATQIMSMLRNEFNVDLPLVTLFEQRTISNIARIISDALNTSKNENIMEGVI